MKKVLSIILLAFAPVMALANSGAHLPEIDIDVTDQEALQRGAKMFVNYCQGCHALGYMRYNRMAQDMGLNKEETEDNLIFTTDDEGAPTKFGSLMFNNMDKKYGKSVFGTTPPDLSLIARSRGTAWLYAYLNSFYLDPSRPLGVNNTVFKDVGMPHVLWKLQGWQKPVYAIEKNEAGEDEKVIESLEMDVPGKLTPAEYKLAVKDLVTFLAYAAEPAQLQRKAMGIWVLLFLAVFTFVAYLLKKEYWKDVH